MLDITSKALYHMIVPLINLAFDKYDEVLINWIGWNYSLHSISNIIWVFREGKYKINNGRYKDNILQKRRKKENITNSKTAK